MNQNGLVKEYQKTLKDPMAEELVDLVVYRPIAFGFVKILKLIPITPNQVSLLAMLCGIVSGFILAHGSYSHWVVGGIMFGLANVLDCCDGMIARIKHNGTKTGRIVDGLVDYVTNAAAYTGFAVGASHALKTGAFHFPMNIWILMGIAGICTILHSIASDYFRNTYINQRKVTTETAVSEYDAFIDEWHTLSMQRGRWFDKLLVWIYLRYLKVQMGKKTRRSAASFSDTPPKVSTVSVILWNIIGPSTHISSLVAAALLYRPMIFFVFVIGFANVWLLLLLMMRPVLNRFATQ